MDDTRGFGLALDFVAMDALHGLRDDRAGVPWADELLDRGLPGDDEQVLLAAGEYWGSPGCDIWL